MLGTAILDIVAIHRSDDNVVQTKFGNRIRHATRFKDIQGLWRFASRDIAKRAGPRTDFAHNHHGRVPLAPAFANIWAPRLFADGYQFVAAHNLAGFFVSRACGRFDANPIGLARLCVIWLMGLFRMALFWNL
jgi:hypothetical protein